jgi:hypothetical protein
MEMDLTGHGSNHDLAEGLDRVAERIGLLGISRSPVPPVGPTITPSRRGSGSITVAVATVLGSAGEMQARDVHRAIECLRGESVSVSSVKNCLARKPVGTASQFERVSRGRYRLTQCERARRGRVLR